MKQDLPPKSGFGAIKYERNLPPKGPSSVILLLGVGGIMGYGWYHFLKGFKEKEELKREKAWLRISLLPFLQAESDRNTVRILEASKERGYVNPFKTELGKTKVLPQYLPLNAESITLY
eukprot:NODE_9_length_47730_cov_0.323718.p31 type:complete len:119 gc:universal NODE_9_length_47730_cov_0.323718:33627-33271(-)